MVQEQVRRNTEPTEEAAAPSAVASATHGGARKNPYSWMNPILRARWKQHQVLHRILDARRVELDLFEREMLIPEMLGRVEYMREMFERISEIAAAPETAYRIAPVLRELIPQYAEGVDVEPTTDYLTKVVVQIEKAFLSPLRRIEQEFSSITDLEQMMRFFTQLRRICAMLMDLDNVLFRYSAAVTISVTERETGKRLRDEKKEWSIILTPFELALGELKRVAETTEASIEHWRQQQEAAKKPFLEYAAAATNSATSRRTIYIQLLAIALSVAFSSFFLTARDPFALAKENRGLRNELESVKGEVARLTSEVDRLRTQPAEGQHPSQ